MVTDDEWAAAMRMRSSGNTLKKISAELNIPISTLSYHFKKMRDSGLHNSSIDMINVVSFKPKETVISFTPHDFENHRINHTLYSTGMDIYEMRQGVIHHTKLPETPLFNFNRTSYNKDGKLMMVHEGVRRIFKGSDYPRIAYIIKDNPGWNDLLTQTWHLNIILHPEFHVEKSSLSPIRRFGDKYSKELGRLRGNPEIELLFHEIWEDKYISSVEEMFPDMPKLMLPDKEGEALWGLSDRFADTSRKEKVARKRYRFDTKNAVDLLIYMIENSLTPNKILSAYKEKSKDVKAFFVIDKKRSKYPEFLARILGHQGAKEEDFDLALEVGCTDPDLLRELREYGAPDIPSLYLIKDLGFTNWSSFEECCTLGKEIFNACKSQFPTRNVPHGHQSRVVGGELEFVTKTSFMMNYTIQTGYKEDEAGRETETSSDGSVKVWKRKSPRFKHIVDVKKKRSFVKESLLPVLREIDVSHIAIGVKLGVEDWKKFSKKVRTHELFGDDINEEIMQTKDPILDITVFRDLSDPKKRKTRINSKIINAVKRRDMEDVVTAAWTRFESHSKSLWEKELDYPLPKNGSFLVKLTEEMRKIMDFDEKMMQNLTTARQIRSDLSHGDEPREKIKVIHVRAVLNATEKIIVRLGK
ncbi:MAG: winged helix-turn-helix domain-containing protein [Candidatus Thalassarchaeum sp.]